MKKIIFIITCMFICSFADDNNCEILHQRFVNAIDEQITTICRVSGVEDNRDDIMGFFFTFKGNQQAVFIYGTNYDEFLYSMNDELAKRVKCIENDSYRALKAQMTSEQIAAKLLSFKSCGNDYSVRHPGGVVKYIR